MGRVRDLSVVQTQAWLYNFVESCTKHSRDSLYTIQCRFIGDPLIEFTPELIPEELHYHLLQHGLFDPIEWKRIARVVRKMEEKKVWHKVELEYQRLRNIWSGPEVSIFIFPIKQRSHKSNKRTPSKNGLAYNQCLFLFLSPELVTEEINALLAHEYNHICRLDYSGKKTNEVTLKDSLIVEGLGEYSVKDLYGEKWLSPWVNLYTFEETYALWQKYFIPSLDLIGIENHHSFLYGDVKRGLPKWIGYYIGFQIVDTFQKKHGPLKSNELYQLSSEELVAGSRYSSKDTDSN